MSTEKSCIDSCTYVTVSSLKGFTLVELLITLVIIGILASIAIPSYSQYVIRGKRADAQAQMMDIANREQQFLLANRAYADKTTLESNGYILPTSVGSSYTYSITVGSTLNAACAVATSATPSFVITFTPVATGSQSRDGNLLLSNEGTKCPSNKW